MLKLDAPALINHILERANISHDQLARLIGTHPQTLYRWRANKLPVGAISMRFLALIATIASNPTAKINIARLGLLMPSEEDTEFEELGP